MSILILVFGCALIAAGISIRSAAVRGRDWPTTSAKVLERRVQHSSRNVGYPVVRYSYTVGGTSYESDNVYAAGKVSKEMGETQRMVDGLPETIEIHYDPADPHRAYIFSTPSIWYWIPLVAGAVLALVGLVWIVGGGATKS